MPPRSCACRSRSTAHRQRAPRAYGGLRLGARLVRGVGLGGRSGLGSAPARPRLQVRARPLRRPAASGAASARLAAAASAGVSGAPRRGSGAASAGSGRRPLRPRCASVVSSAGWPCSCSSRSIKPVPPPRRAAAAPRAGGPAPRRPSASQLLAREPVARQHALHRKPDDLLRPPLQHLLERPASAGRPGSRNGGGRASRPACRPVTWISAAFTTTTKSPVSICGVYSGLRLPRSMSAIWVARRPSVLPRASTSTQSRWRSEGLAT